jgi:hypothetical protein
MIAANVVRRFLASGIPDLQGIQDNLEALKELDANLTGIEDAFDNHFDLTAASALEPVVDSQIKSILKAKEGLKAAQEMVKQTDIILNAFPDEKGALKTKAEAVKMVERFTKHMEAARKIVRTISKKAQPDALKKETAIAEKLISARLVNPAALDVIHWQTLERGYIPGAYGRDQNVKCVTMLSIFRIEGSPWKRNEGEPTLRESTDARLPGVHWTIGYERSAGPSSGKDFAEAVFKALRGWPGLKGEAEATQARAGTAAAIAKKLDSVAQRLTRLDHDRVEISDDKTEISTSYRSNLPKEGAYDVGSSRYEEMVSAEINRCRRTLDPEIANWKDAIKSVDVHDGEKGWIYITVRLK